MQIVTIDVSSREVHTVRPLLRRYLHVSIKLCRSTGAVALAASLATHDNMHSPQPSRDINPFNGRVTYMSFLETNEHTGLMSLKHVQLVLSKSKSRKHVLSKSCQRNPTFSEPAYVRQQSLTALKLTDATRLSVEQWFT